MAAFQPSLHNVGLRYAFMQDTEAVRGKNPAHVYMQNLILLTAEKKPVSCFRFFIYICNLILATRGTLRIHG